MNIKDIARLAGVSPTTVSKILNRKDQNISSQTRAVVLDTIKKYHYTPYARITAQRNTWLVGVCVRETKENMCLVSGIIEALQKHHISTLVIYTREESREEQVITELIQSNISALIWEPLNTMQTPTNTTIDNLCVKHDIEVLKLAKDGGKQNYSIDFETLAHDLSAELILAGHRHIACLTNKETPRAFIQGYASILFQRKIMLAEQNCYTSVCNELLQALVNGDITAVVCASWQQAQDLRTQLYTLHIQAPQDFSLVCLQSDAEYALQSADEQTQIDTGAANTNGCASVVYSYLNTPISAYSISYKDFGTYIAQQLQIANQSVANDDGNAHKQDTASDAVFNFIPTHNALTTQASIASPQNNKHERIVIVGSINIDTQLLVDHIPGAGSTVTTTTSHISAGGKGLNYAIGVAKLAHKAVLIGNIGDDSESSMIYKELSRWNIDTKGVVRTKDEQTGKAYICVDKQGTSTITILTGANSKLCAQDIIERKHLFRNASLCLIPSEVPLDAAEQACKEAKRQGAQVIFKPVALTEFPKRMAAYIDYIIPNEHELATLCRTLKNCVQARTPHRDDRTAKKTQNALIDQAHMLLNLGIPHVIVTRGEKGCDYFSASSHIHTPSHAFKTIDTTGASDAFICAFATSLLSNDSVERALDDACYAAGYSTTRPGVVQALIDAQTLELYRERHIDTKQNA